MNNYLLYYYSSMDQAITTEISTILNSILAHICGEVEVEITKEGEQHRINIISDNGNKLLEEDGHLLNALQHLIRVLVHKTFPDDKSHFVLDVFNGRLKRERYIQEEIPNIAKNDVLLLGNTVIIKNLSSYERLIIHQLLVEVKGLETTSVGEDKNRKLLIRPTSETGTLGLDNSKIIDINRIDYQL
jgi:spoIIIJ-associated protein